LPFWDVPGFTGQLVVTINNDSSHPSCSSLMEQRLSLTYLFEGLLPVCMGIVEDFEAIASS
jgi:hypothetical protein